MGGIEQADPNLEFLKRCRDAPEADPCVPIFGPPHKNLRDAQEMLGKAGEETQEHIDEIACHYAVERKREIMAHPDALEHIDDVVDPAPLDAEPPGRVVQPHRLHVVPVVQRHEATTPTQEDNNLGQDTERYEHSTRTSRRRRERRALL